MARLSVWRSLLGHLHRLFDTKIRLAKASRNLREKDHLRQLGDTVLLRDMEVVTEQRREKAERYRLK